MVVPRAFHSCWKLLTFDQIQLDACCPRVWRRFESTFKLQPVIPIFERNVMTEYPRKPRQPTSIGITWHIQPFSTQSARSVSYQFFPLVCFLPVFFPERRTVFESDHATISGHFSVWIMWTGNCRDVFISAETFRSLAFGKRSYVDQRRNDIASGSIAIKDFYDNLIGSISFHFVQAHCLAWVTALAVLCSSSNILTSSLTMSLFPSGPILENSFLLVLPNPARLVWVTPMMYLICRLHSASWAALTTNHFEPYFISGYSFRMISSAETFIIMWRRIFPILKSSTSEDIGSCRFPELLYKPTIENQGGTPSQLRRYLLLYCWIRSTQDIAISYIFKGHEKTG